MFSAYVSIHGRPYDGGALRTIQELERIRTDHIVRVGRPAATQEECKRITAELNEKHNKRGRIFRSGYVVCFIVCLYITAIAVLLTTYIFSLYIGGRAEVLEYQCAQGRHTCGFRVKWIMKANSSKGGRRTRKPLSKKPRSAASADECGSESDTFDSDASYSEDGYECGACTEELEPKELGMSDRHFADIVSQSAYWQCSVLEEHTCAGPYIAKAREKRSNYSALQLSSTLLEATRKNVKVTPKVAAVMLGTYCRDAVSRSTVTAAIEDAHRSVFGDTMDGVKALDALAAHVRSLGHELEVFRLSGREMQEFVISNELDTWRQRAKRDAHVVVTDEVKAEITKRSATFLLPQQRR